MEFADVSMEYMGYLNRGRMQFTEQKVSFRNAKTSKVETIAAADVDKCQWTRLANKPALKIVTSNDQIFRFCGFDDNDYEKVKSFVKNTWKKELEDLELCVKGWNYGRTAFDGPNLSFLVDEKLAFEIPLSNVSNATGGRNEAALELHRNDECAVALDSIRFHMPAADTESSAGAEDPVKEFVESVLKHAGVVRDTDRHIVRLEQLLCTTPRGRYDVKVFPSHLSFHGKTFDYKVPIKTIMRLFLLPSKDGRHKYFVMGLDPPIRQGQTRYHYMVLEFANEDELDITLELTDEQLAKYENKLQRELSGPSSEVVSRILRALTGQRITVPGSFVGNTGTPAVQCAYKSAAGLLYPLEKGFVFVHKPATYLRYDDVAQIFFDRSGAGVRSFDFEVQLANGNVFTFNSIPKEEYTKLFDFMEKKKMRIKNKKSAQQLAAAADDFMPSDEEIDPYKNKLKEEVEKRQAEDSGDSGESEEDSDYDPEKEQRRKKEKAQEAGSEASGSGSEPDEEYDTEHASEEGSGSEGGSRPKKAKTVREHKQRRGDKPPKRRKDPDAPKRPMSAYFVWLGEKRASIKDEGMSVADVAKKAGDLWKAMSAADKQEWDEKAAKDKERYEREMKAYKAASGGGASTSTTIKKPYIKSASSAAAGGSGGGGEAKSKEYVSSSGGSDSDDGDKDESKKSADKTGDKAKSDSASASGSDAASD